VSILFSRRCEYALQAVLFVASRPADRMTTIREMTQELGIPYHFLAKILRDLSLKGLLRSHKGPRGGFILGRSPEHITLSRIVEAVDGSGFRRGCILGFQECSEQNRCALHNEWASVRDGIQMMLINRTVAELAGDMRKPGYQRSQWEAPI